MAAAVLAGGALAIWLLKPSLSSSDQALGPHTAALFVPFAAGLVALARYAWRRGPGNGMPATPLVVFVLLSTLFLKVLFQPIAHYRGDDPWRYSVYAHNMLDEGTLWGSDGVYYKHGQKAFVDQPGYRYYLAATIWLSGGENRLTQILSLLLLLTVLTLGVSTLTRFDTSLSRYATLILMLSAPYAAKNVVQGLSEWLAVSLAILYVAALTRDRHILAIALLALVPFVRQNLIPIAVALAAIQVAVTRRYVLALPFAALFLLPVYHNLYYAGDFRLLVENRGAILHLATPLGSLVPHTLQLLTWKLGTYVGIPKDHIDLHTIAAALLFAPAALLGTLYFTFVRPASPRVLCVAALMLIAGPTMLFGSAYFPRFIYTNYTLAFLSFIALAHLWPNSISVTSPGP
ncbi:MAG: hypothetical protein WAL83_04285 [Arenicellales bacterium]